MHWSAANKEVPDLLDLNIFAEKSPPLEILDPMLPRGQATPSKVTARTGTEMTKKKNKKKKKKKKKNRLKPLRVPPRCVPGRKGKEKKTANELGKENFRTCWPICIVARRRWARNLCLRINEVS